MVPHSKPRTFHAAGSVFLCPPQLVMMALTCLQAGSYRRISPTPRLQAVPASNGPYVNANSTFTASSSTISQDVAIMMQVMSEISPLGTTNDPETMKLYQRFSDRFCKWLAAWDGLSPFRSALPSDTYEYRQQKKIAMTKTDRWQHRCSDGVIELLLYAVKLGLPVIINIVCHHLGKEVVSACAEAVSLQRATQKPFTEQQSELPSDFFSLSLATLRDSNANHSTAYAFDACLRTLVRWGITPPTTTYIADASSRYKQVLGPEEGGLCSSLMAGITPPADHLLQYYQENDGKLQQMKLMIPPDMRAIVQLPYMMVSN
jgi:hypothetical protein